MQLQVKQFQTRATWKTIKTGTIDVLKCTLKIYRARMKAQWDEGG